MGLLTTHASTKIDIVTFGEMLVDFVPTITPSTLSDATEFFKAAGGAPANVAIAASRLGGKSAFVGKMGDDDFGHMLDETLTSNGVCNDGVVFDENARTALAFVSLKDDGDREFMFYRHPSADMLLRDDELDLNLIRKAKIFHYGSISLISEPCRSAHIKAMLVAKEAGSLLSYDPNLRLALWPNEKEAKKQITSIWNEADIIKISDSELEFLTGHEGVNDDVVMSLWHSGLKLLLVTLGSKGCKYYTKNFIGTVNSFKVKAVDTTGAGDSFVGGMLHKLVSDLTALKDEKKLREVLMFANACGAITATGKGAIPAMPNEAEALEFLKNA